MDANPYESPREINEQTEWGVGSWRDGDLLVMHLNAQLPPYCVHTNEPADGAREFVLGWRELGSLAGAYHRFWFPQARRLLHANGPEKYLHRAGSVLNAICGICFVGIFGVVLQVPQKYHIVVVPPLVIGSLIGGIGGLGLWLVASYYRRPPLRMLRSSSPYVWFADAHTGFLDRLPDWPGVSAESPERK